MKINSLTNPITVDGTVVILPTTPKLDKRIVSARSRFRKGKSLKWEKVRNEFV